MNLLQLKKSRTKPRPGDVFAYSPVKGRFYFGRVIRDDALWAEGGECLLCYAYDAFADRIDDIPDLTGAKFLIPPFLINRLPWSRGYFVQVGHLPLTSDERERVHVFVDTGNNLYDEYLRPVTSPSEGAYPAGMKSYASFDYYISKKLGLPLDGGDE